jgi:acetyl esterase
LLLNDELGKILPSLVELAPAQARKRMAALTPPVDPLFAATRVEDRNIPGPGGRIPIRFYYPEGNPPFPVLVYFHGGGWVVGSLDSHHAFCHALSKTSGCLVAAVDYRLAPEHPYPAPIEDAFAATCWVRENAAAVQADADRMAVGGDSAGATLATVVTLMARDRGGPRIVLQVLIYPITDRNFETPSYRQNADGYMLTRALMMWFWDHYLPLENLAADPYVSPLRAEDLSHLPQALILTAEYDPLRDEGEAYARRLKAADVPVKLSRYDGMIHGFIRMTSRLDKARVALNEVAHALKRAFQIH